MSHTITREGDSLVVHPRGHLDIKTSPKLEEELVPQLDGVKTLTVDLAEVNYVSSMGLRLLLYLRKRMAKQGTMTVINASDEVLTLFEETGFSDILSLA